MVWGFKKPRAYSCPEIEDVSRDNIPGNLLHLLLTIAVFIQDHAWSTLSHVLHEGIRTQIVCLYIRLDNLRQLKLMFSPMYNPGYVAYSLATNQPAEYERSLSFKHMLILLALR